MICKPCQRQDHEQCPDSKRVQEYLNDVASWPALSRMTLDCDCQHKPPIPSQTDSFPINQPPPLDEQIKEALAVYVKAHDDALEHNKREAVSER